MMKTLAFRRGRLLLLTLLVLLGVGVSPTWAEELTVNDKTDLNQYIPVYGYYADSNGNTSEFIIPASSLSSMTGATISSIKFYSNTESQSWGSARYKVYAKNVANSTLSSYVGYASSSVVYEGALTIVGNEMTISFSNPFVYEDGNLLIGTSVSTTGTCSSSGAVKFYGDANCGSGVSRYKGYSESSSTFLPKITFTYTPSVGFMSKPKDVNVSSLEATSATIGWTAGGDETAWEVSCSTSSGVPAEVGSYTEVNTTPSYEFTGLTSGTTYYVYVRAKDGDNHSKWSAVCSFTPGVLTINNVSTTKNASVPLWGYNMDGQAKSQFIIPKTSLSPINGMHITKFVFYGTTDKSADFSSNTLDVYVKEVDDATISSLFDWNTLEKVYSGSLSISDGKMIINLGDGFDFSGDKNLLIGFNQTNASGKWSNTSWDGVSATGASVGGYGSSVSQKNFLPQISFYYEPQSSAPKLKVEAESTYDFAFLTSASEAADKTAMFTVRNNGNAALTDANVAYLGNDAITLSATGTLSSIAAKGSTDITITVNTTTPGTYSGTITITGTGSEDVVIPVKAIVRNTDKLFVDFDANNPKPASWTLDAGWSVNVGGYATIGSSTATITTGEVLSGGEQLLLRFRGNYNGDGASLAVSYAATIDGEYTDCSETVSSIGYNEWKTATFTIPASAKFVKITGKYIDLDAFYGLQVPAVPVIVLSATSHNFGLVTDANAQALILTIRNEGGTALTGLTVTPPAGFTVTDAEGGALATTIAAGSSLTAKVKMTAAGLQSGTITIAGTGIVNQEVTVSGYMTDDTKILETFAGSLPGRWTAPSWTYNSTTGAFSTTSTRTMTTPKITVAGGDVLAINARMSSANYNCKIEGSSDNGETWTAYTRELRYADDFGSQTTSYKLIVISDIPTEVNKLRITGEYLYINLFNGFTYAVEPGFATYSNSICTTSQASPATKNFGFVAKNAEAPTQLYYIKNTGNGQTDLSVVAPSGYTAVFADAELTEGESTALTITMTTDTEGLREGVVTVTAKNHDTDAVLGTFTVNVNGAVTDAKNNVVLTAFPAGWQNNNWTIYNSAARINSGTASDLVTTAFVVTEGEKLLVEASKMYDGDSYPGTLTYSYSTDNGTSWSEAVALTSGLSTTYKIFEISGVPEAERVLMKFTGTYAYIRQIYGFTAVTEPIMTFADAGSTCKFGMITSAATSDAFTIKNEGTATLSGLSVTCDNPNFEIAVADDATSIAVGGQVTFTVTLNTTVKGMQNGTVTIKGTGVDNKTFNVNGCVVDDTKIYTTFTSKPARWTNSGWTFSANGAGTTNSSNTLVSPKITITEGQKLYISAKQQYSGSGYYVTINGSDNNGATWAAYTKTLNNTQLNNSDYTVVELDDVPTTVNKLQLVGYYVYVNGLNGFTPDANDPEMKMYSNAGCTSEIAAATVTNAWGFLSTDMSATYYVKNIGTGTMTVSASAAPAGFTAVLGENSLGAGESTSLTISMANNSTTNEGYHAGDVVLTAKNSSDATLGTFTVTSSGVVVGSKSDINFTSLSDFPAGWEATNWTVTANTKATVGYSSGTLTTGTFAVAAGEALVILAKGNSSYSAPTLTYQYSTNGGENWTTGTSPLSYTYHSSNYQLQAITDIPAADEVKIKFTGQYVDIQRIYGYTVVAKPVMALAPAAASYDFEMQTAPATYDIIVTNSGTAVMNNLSAALETGTDYSVAITIPDGSTASLSEGKATVPVNQTVKVTVTQKFDASKGLASLSDVLTISADGVSSKEIALSGQTRDADKWYVDFASGIPADFVETGSWTASSPYASTTSGTETALVTKPIDLAAGEKIQFEAKNPYSGSLKVRYSLNGGISWSDYVDYTSQLNSSTFTSLELDLENDEAETAVVEFLGKYYIQLDNIYGGVVNSTVPVIAVTKSATAVENGATEAFGSILDEATATYTITNIGNGTLTIASPVTKTGEAIVTVSETSLGNGESATLTITMPVAAPYEEKNGVVTVETGLGDFVINYTATVLNPNALNIDFADNQKPAGWYFGGYWEVDSKEAKQTSSGIADLVTQKLHAAGPTDALTFQAARSSSSNAPTFKVYTSTDRANWTEVDLSGVTLTTSYQDITINGLAAGDYYVKISGARVKVDNFLGWEKVTGVTRDLYVTATSFPATSRPGNTINPSATVTSLLSDETGVYAKLFIDGTEVATATPATADISKNVTQTFSMSYTLPAAVGTLEAQIKVYYSDDSEAFATAVKNIEVDYESVQYYDDLSNTIAEGTYNVTHRRTFVEGWNTVCLPFEVAVSDIHANAGAYKFSSYNTSTKVLTFDKVTSLEAGQPYVIYVPEAVTDKVFNGVTVSATSAGNVVSNGVTFQGTYTKVTFSELDGGPYYGLTASGKIAKAGDSATMKGFRAYFSGISAGASARFIGGGDEETTGILSISIETTAPEGTYNMKGQKVEKLNKGGLYIVNGKKVVVK